MLGHSNMNSVILIAGPTASGKSDAAMALARAIGGVIINADAIQVYQDLRVITARPSPEDEAAIPHFLYGYLDGEERGSAGKWAKQVASLLADITQTGQVPILVGGTGLYFKALTDGLADIPAIADDVRKQAQARLEQIGPTAFKAEILTFDPEMAHLSVNDRQRLIRAWEVYHATGNNLSHYHNQPRQPICQTIKAKFILQPPRDRLYANCDGRVPKMLTMGALAEVETLRDRHLAADLPIMKALGVPELMEHLDGKTNLSTAQAHIQQNTRRFAKRQMTWFRQQCQDWTFVETGEDLMTAFSAL